VYYDCEKPVYIYVSALRKEFVRIIIEMSEYRSPHIEKFGFLSTHISTGRIVPDMQRGSYFLITPGDFLKRDRPTTEQTKLILNYKPNVVQHDISVFSSSRKDHKYDRPTVKDVELILNYKPQYVEPTHEELKRRHDFPLIDFLKDINKSFYLNSDFTFNYMEEDKIINDFFDHVKPKVANFL
jgi:hypothetical protein